MLGEAWTQTVAPNKARRETLFVLLAALAIVVVSAITIHFNQRQSANAESLAQFEISSRYDLTPAEQGIYTDLLLVYEDWLLQSSSEPNPEIDTLIAENWPPFTDAIEQKKRGDHKWTKHHIDGHDAYLGIAQDKDIAKDFLWFLPSTRESASLDDFTVWLSQSDAPLNIAELSVESIRKAGWKQVRHIQ